VAMKGRPKRRNGCRASWDRYLAAIVFASADDRNFLFGKTAMVSLTLTEDLDVVLFALELEVVLVH